MPIASPEKYAEMIDAAKNGAFAYPAINVTSSQTLNAAIRGFAEAGSDGIVQVSTGGAAYFSGSSVKDMVAGSLAFAAFAREVADTVVFMRDGVVVGAGAKILGPVEIGEGTAVGANAVVVKDTPADAIATGVPATVRPRKGPSEGKPLVDPAEYVDPALWI